jgi:hypothetical protein
MPTIITIPRVFGGTILYMPPVPSTPIPTVVLTAQFRSGESGVLFRSGEANALFRIGEDDAAFRSGEMAAAFRDGRATEESR